MRLFTAALALFVVFLSAPKADAAPITWKFTGEVTRINHFTGTDPFYLGSLVSFTATFDSAAPDQCGSAGRGFYALPGGTMDVGGGSYGSSANYLEVNNPEGSCLGPLVDVPQSNSLRFTGFDGLPMIKGATVGWTNGPEMGEGMPSILPDPLNIYFNIGFDRVTGSQVHGRMLSVEVVQTVPEPGTLLLVGAGMAGVLRRLTRRRT